MTTAFSKSPIFLRKGILLSIVLIQTLVLISQYLLKSEYLFLTIFFTIVIILYLGFVLYKYKNGLKNKIQKFIIHNKLYNDNMSAEVGYLVKNEQVIICFKKNADLFTDKANQFMNYFQATLDLPL